MFENISIGLDIASALSIIAAAVAFIINSIHSKKNEQNERKKEIIKSHVFKVADKIMIESNSILKEIDLIATKVESGQTNLDLNYLRDKIFQLPNSFIFLEPLDNVYLKNGKFVTLKNEFTQELNDFLIYFAELVNPNRKSKEKWPFWEVMNTPSKITIKYISKLYKETEDFFDGIN